MDALDETKGTRVKMEVFRAETLKEALDVLEKGRTERLRR